jgi:hypothetical protein
MSTITEDEGTTRSPGIWSAWEHQTGKGWGYLQRHRDVLVTHRWRTVDITTKTEILCSNMSCVYNGSECVPWQTYYGEPSSGTTSGCGRPYKHTVQHRDNVQEHQDSWLEPEWQYRSLWLPADRIRFQQTISIGAGSSPGSGRRVPVGRANTVRGGYELIDGPALIVQGNALSFASGAKLKSMTVNGHSVKPSSAIRTTHLPLGPCAIEAAGTIGNAERHFLLETTVCAPVELVVAKPVVTAKGARPLTLRARLKNATAHEQLAHVEVVAVPPGWQVEVAGDPVTKLKPSAGAAIRLQARKLEKGHADESVLPISIRVRPLGDKTRQSDATVYVTSAT